MARKFWWAKSLPEQNNTVKNFHDKFENYKTPLDLTGAEIDAWKKVCESFMGAYNFRVQTEQTNQAVTEWRDQVFYGTPKGDAVSPPPVYMVMGDVSTYSRGVVTQFFEIRDNVLARAGYTPAIGEDLGLIGPEQEAPDLPTFQPTVKAEAAMQGGFAFGVTVGHRGESDQWILSGALVGTTDWQQLGTFTGKVADVVWPGGGSVPVQIQLRVQLRLKNGNYGQPSDIVLVTLIP